MSIALFWFRQDLRCHDNPALTQACTKHQNVIPLYIKESTPSLDMGRAQRWWLHHSLAALKHFLNERNLDLFLRQGDALSILKELIEKHPIEAVYWNRCYEPNHRIRDERIKKELKKQGIKVISCNGSLLHEPWELLNQAGEYFKVFTPYWRQCLKQMQEPVEIVLNNKEAIEHLMQEINEILDTLSKEVTQIVVIYEHYECEIHDSLRI